MLLFRFLVVTIRVYGLKKTARPHGGRQNISGVGTKSLLKVSSILLLLSKSPLLTTAITSSPRNSLLARSAKCFGCWDQKSTKSLFDLTPSLEISSPHYCNNFFSKKFTSRSIDWADDQGTCLKGSDA